MYTKLICILILALKSLTIVECPRYGGDQVEGRPVGGGTRWRGGMEGRYGGDSGDQVEGKYGGN